MSEIQVRLPDGKTLDLRAGSTVIDVAGRIGPGLAKAALAGRVDGRLVDLRTPLEADCAIEIVTSRPTADLVDEYGLRERRVVQMAAGASLIEATLDCYNLERLEASDASLREGAILAWDQAGEAWREDIGALVSGV